jgi:uncharacterized membrane protein
VLRGIVMIFMILDHVRDYFTNVHFDPLDLAHTSALLFMTRWVTHFCAPTFIFLSGISAYLSASKRKDKRGMAVFLFKRGLWLIFLELTVIGFGWQFDPGFHFVFLQVIWAIGWSMIVLSFMIFLKPKYIGGLGLLMIFSHNLLDHIHSNGAAIHDIFWLFLHGAALYPLHNHRAIFIIYPLIPWVGVMMVGYAMGAVFTLESKIRKAILLQTGLASLMLFVLLRSINIYGDPNPWRVQDVWWKTVLDFFRCNKYPPSLLYLLMILGTSVLILGWLENVYNKITSFLMVFGRVPLFLYLIHVYLVHLTQLVIAFFAGFSLRDMVHGPFRSPYPTDWGFELPVVYTVWVFIIIALYWPCRWFMRIKQQRKAWWLSYL